MGRGTAYRGWLVVEPARHVHELADLTDEEAAALGVAVSRAAAVLRRVVGAEHVYSFVLGDGVAHLHVHVVPRYPGTPREHWGMRIGDWADAPQISADEIRELVGRLHQGWPSGRGHNGGEWRAR